MKKILLSLLIAFALILSVMPMQSAAKSDDNLSLQKFIAWYHIKADVESNESSGWSDTTIITKEAELYDLDGNISSYTYYLKDKGKNNGYIIIGASRKYAPIIEFSYDGIPVADMIEEVGKAEYKKNSFKKLYIGGYDYYLESDSEIYDLKTNNFKIKSKKEFAEFTESIEPAAELYEEQWNYYQDTMTGDSNPPDGVIINPYTGESGYLSTSSYDVDGYAKYYFDTSYFSGYSDHCAPTSAINLMLYYGYQYNNSWTTSFELMYDYMDTNVYGTGTTADNLEDGLEAYLTTVGEFDSVSQVSNPSVSTMITEINNDYPFIFNVYGHNEYGDHSMLSVGYIKFNYYYGITSTYLRVADAWSRSFNRYVHTTEGYEPNENGREGIDFIFKYHP